MTIREVKAESRIDATRSNELGAANQAGDNKYWGREVMTELSPGIRRVGGWQDVVEWVKEEGKEIADVGGRGQAPLGA